MRIGNVVFVLATNVSTVSTKSILDLVQYLALLWAGLTFDQDSLNPSLRLK
jgi:hypothetical protein